MTLCFLIPSSSGVNSCYVNYSRNLGCRSDICSGRSIYAMDPGCSLLLGLTYCTLLLSGWACRLFSCSIISTTSTHNSFKKPQASPGTASALSWPRGSSTKESYPLREANRRYRLSASRFRFFPFALALLKNMIGL